MSGVRPFVEHAADVLGQGLEALVVLLVVVAAVLGLAALAVGGRARS